jgi:ElaB/YqjD/DUF883 family membrane-anchored ribosome-binding protein
MAAIDGKLASDLSRLTTEIEELLKVTAEHGDERVAATREHIATTLKQAQAVAQEFGKEFSETAERTAGAVDNYVHRHPWNALVVVAAVGVVVGFLLGRK